MGTELNVYKGLYDGRQRLADGWERISGWRRENSVGAGPFSRPNGFVFRSKIVLDIREILI
jgi:hypothetical protein